MDSPPTFFGTICGFDVSEDVFQGQICNLATKLRFWCFNFKCLSSAFSSSFPSTKPCECRLRDAAPSIREAENLLLTSKGILYIHLRKLTWNLKNTQSKRKIIFQTSIFGFHVNFPGSIYNGEPIRHAHPSTHIATLHTFRTWKGKTSSKATLLGFHVSLCFGGSTQKENHFTTFWLELQHVSWWQVCLRPSGKSDGFSHLHVFLQTKVNGCFWFP